MIASLKELYSYRDLLLVFIWREFAVRYKQSTIGVLWAIIQPLSMMLLFTFVFTIIMPSRISEHPYPVFFYVALLPWTFFSSSINYAVPSLVNHYQLVTKIYFPREVLPLAGIAVAFVDFVIGFAFFLVLLLVFQTPVNVSFLWAVPLTFLMLLFTTAVSLLLAALNVYYRDVKVAISFLVQLWFFATPVFYSIDHLPMHYKILLSLNPLTFIVENMRRSMIAGREVVLWQFGVMFLLILILSALAYKFFKTTEKRFADVI